MKKKLCFVLDQFLYGGIERVAINYLNGIDKDKYDIDVVILSNIEDMVNKIPKECNVIKINIPRYHNPLSRASTMVRRKAGAILYYGTYILKKIFIYPLDYIRTSNLRKKTYDVAIAFSGHLNDCYVVLDCMKAKKKLVWAHGMIYQYLLMSPAFEKMYSRFDKIVSINHIDQNDIFYCKPYLKYNIVNLYNPTLKINKTNSIDDVKKYNKYILSVARLEHPKDFITLVDAYNLLDEKIKKEYNLLIVGDGPDRDKIFKHIEKLKLSEKVYLLGAKDNVDVYYQNADLFVLSTKAEGLGMVIIEAMGNGCPVISTDAPYGPRDILGSNKYGVLCPVSDSKFMAKSIEEMLSNNKLRKEYIEKGLVRYKDFELSTIMQQFYEVIGDKNEKQ